MSVDRSERNKVEREESARWVIKALVAGWTQRELADLLDVGVGAVKGWCQARNRANNKTRLALKEIASSPRFGRKARLLFGHANFAAHAIIDTKTKEMIQLDRGPNDARFSDPVQAEVHRSRRIAAVEHVLRMQRRRSKRLNEAVDRKKPKGFAPKGFKVTDELDAPARRKNVASDFNGGDLEDPPEDRWDRDD